MYNRDPVRRPSRRAQIKEFATISAQYCWQNKCGEPPISSFDNEKDARKIVESQWSAFEPIPLEQMGTYSPVFSGVLDYISGKTGGGRMARRSDIDPTEIVPFLPHLVIFDVIDGDDTNDLRRDYIMRLMGTSVASNYGEHTGKSVTQLPNKQASARIQQACTEVIETRLPIGTLARELSDHKNYLQALGLYIPLTDDTDKVVQILVVAIVTAASN